MARSGQDLGTGTATPAKFTSLPPAPRSPAWQWSWRCSPARCVSRYVGLSVGHGARPPPPPARGWPGRGALPGSAARALASGSLAATSGGGGGGGAGRVVVAWSMYLTCGARRVRGAGDHNMRCHAAAVAPACPVLFFFFFFWFEFHICEHFANLCWCGSRRRSPRARCSRA